MCSLPRYVLLLALSFACVGFIQATTSQTKTQKKPTTGSVSGRITIHGRGAAGIVVSMRKSDSPPQPNPTLKAIADQDGNYRITDVPAGNYQIAPMAPAFVSPDQVGSLARGKTLLLGEGEDVQGIDFSVIPGGVITGKVTDIDGRPLVEERLTVVPEDQSDARGRMPPVLGSMFQTDDRGIYRIYGLPPGRYKISVGVSEQEFYSNVRGGRVAYKRTFYPAAAEPGDAGAVEITEGAEATNIDITVGRSLPRFAAVGKVVDGETEQPVAGLRFGIRRLVNDREGVVMGALTTSNSQGEFRLENVTPGKYVAFIAAQPGSEVRVDSVAFEVIDQDVTGLLLKTFKGLTITGSVIVEDNHDKTVVAKLAQLRLQVYVSDGSNSSSSWQNSIINNDGSFRLGGLGSGRAYFSLTQEDRRPPVNFSIARVERDGVAQPRGVEIKAGEQTSSLKIIVRYGTGSVRGEVKLENGPLPPGGRVQVWIKKLGDTDTSFRPYGLDARGRFLIEGVAAGSYELNVNANFPRVRAVPGTKQSINVTEGAVTEVVVSLDLDPGQQPTP